MSAASDFWNLVGTMDARNGVINNEHLDNQDYMQAAQKVNSDKFTSANSKLLGKGVNLMGMGESQLGTTGYSRRHFAKALQNSVKGLAFDQLSDDQKTQLTSLGINDQQELSAFQGMGGRERRRLALTAQQLATTAHNYNILQDKITPVEPEKPVESVIAPISPIYTYKGLGEGVEGFGGRNAKVLGLLGTEFIQNNIDTDKDGIISADELKTFQGGLGTGSNFTDSKLGNNSIKTILSKYNLADVQKQGLMGLQGMQPRPAARRPVAQKPAQQVVQQPAAQPTQPAVQPTTSKPAAFTAHKQYVNPLGRMTGFTDMGDGHYAFDAIPGFSFNSKNGQAFYNGTAIGKIGGGDDGGKISHANFDFYNNKGQRFRIYSNGTMAMHDDNAWAAEWDDIRDNRRNEFLAALAKNPNLKAKMNWKALDYNTLSWKQGGKLISKNK